MKFGSLYKCITLSVQRYTKLPFVKDFNQTTPLFSLSPKDCTPMSCTLFKSHMKIPILSSIMIFGEKNLTLSHPPVSQPNHWKYGEHTYINTKLKKDMKFALLYKGITLTIQGKYVKCTRVYKALNRFCMIFKQLEFDIRTIIYFCIFFIKLFH